MKVMKRNALLLFAINVSLFMILSGCGYKPSSHYAKQVVGDKVSTQVIISLEDPENTVIIRDAVETAVITHFKASLTERAYSDTHLVVNLQNVGFSPLQFDENGYIVVYRTRAALEVTRITGETSKKYTVSGIYDFAIEPNAIISDQARFEAIRFSAQKALDGFIARVSAEGVRLQQ